MISSLLEASQHREASTPCLRVNPHECHAYGDARPAPCRLPLTPSAPCLARPVHGACYASLPMTATVPQPSRSLWGGGAKGALILPLVLRLLCTTHATPACGPSSSAVYSSRDLNSLLASTHAIPKVRQGMILVYVGSIGKAGSLLIRLATWVGSCKTPGVNPLTGGLMARMRHVSWRWDSRLCPLCANEGVPPPGAGAAIRRAG
jgi:hypothetical protein